MSDISASSDISSLQELEVTMVNNQTIDLGKEDDGAEAEVENIEEKMINLTLPEEDNNDNDENSIESLDKSSSAVEEPAKHVEKPFVASPKSEPASTPRKVHFQTPILGHRFDNSMNSVDTTSSDEKPVDQFESESFESDEEEKLLSQEKLASTPQKELASAHLEEHSQTPTQVDSLENSMTSVDCPPLGEGPLDQSKSEPTESNENEMMTPIQKEPASDPEKQPASSPQREPTSSPQGALTSSPQEAPTPSPQRALTPSPQKAPTPSPQKALASTPQKDQSRTPDNEDSPINGIPRQVRFDALKPETGPPKTPSRRSRKYVDTPIRRSARLAAKRKDPMFQNNDDTHDEF